MARRKIGRATNTARAYDPDDPRYERNSRILANEARASSTSTPSTSATLGATPSSPSQPSALQSGTGNSPLAITSNGGLIGSRGGLGFLSSGSITVEQADVRGGNQVVFSASIPDGEKGDITVSGKGTTWTVAPAVITAAITDAALGSGTADASTFLRGDRTWAHIESVRFPVKNTSGSTIPKGYPVYVTGSVGASGEAEISPADSSISGQMPAIGVLEEELLDNASGFAVSLGLIRGLDTSAYVMNGPVYVAAGGGLTATRPTSASVLVQNIARVIRVHASTGEILVMGPGRSNDVPNLIGTQYLGSGTANSTTFLRGDNTWAVPAGGGGGASLAEIRKAVSLRL